MRRLAGLAGIALLGSCSAGLPALPRMAPKGGLGAQAYAEARAKPRDADANGHLGMVFEAAGQNAPAEVCYRRAHRLDPGSSRWSYYLGLVESTQGENKEAAASLRQAGDYLPARLKLVEVLLRLGRLDESQESAKEILSEHPQLAVAYYWLGRVEAAKGLPTLAAEQYRKACKLWPSYGTAHHELAAILEQIGSGAEVYGHIAAYDKFKAEADPPIDHPLLDAMRAIDDPALAHWINGVELEKAGQWQQAIAEHEEARRLDPKLLRAPASLIALYSREGQPGKAERAYRAAIVMNFYRPMSHYDWGVSLAGQGRFAEAEIMFRTTLEISPNCAEAHLELGSLLERQGKMEAAFTEYQAAYEEKPDFRQARYRLGRAMLLRKRPTAAIALLSQTLSPEDDDTPRFMYNLALAYAEAGDRANAASYLEHAGERATSRGQAQLAAEIEFAMARVNPSRVR